MVDPLTRTASAAVRTQCLAARSALHIRMHRLLSVGDALTAADNWQADSSKERCVLSAAYTSVVVECRTRWRQLAGLGLGARAATHLHHASGNHEQGDDDGGPHRHLKALLDEVSGCRAPHPASTIARLRPAHGGAQAPERHAGGRCEITSVTGPALIAPGTWLVRVPDNSLECDGPSALS